MKVDLLFLVLVGVIVFTDAASRGTSRSESPQPGTSCESRLVLCERGLLDLRRQRERVKASRKKLEFQQWRLGVQKKELDNEIVILTQQVNNPGAPVDDVGIGSSGMGEWLDPTEPILSNSEPCDARMRFCERNTERVRGATREHEQICTTLRSDNAQKTQVNAGLRSRADALKRQLVSRGVTPAPSSQLRISDNMQSSKEFDVDDAEIDRRVAELLVTPAPKSTRRHST